MSVFFRAGQPVVEQRDASYSTIASLVSASKAGPDMSKAETSLQSVAVMSTVDLICSLASELPIDVFRGDGAQRAKITTPGYLLDPAGDGKGLEDWCYQVLISWLLRGNLYGNALAYSPSGLVTQMELYYPDDVNGEIVDGVVVWSVKGQKVNQRTFVHRRVMPTPGRVLGMSVVAFHATTIGMSLNATEYGSSFLRDGATPTGILSNESPLTPEQAQTAKERFVAALRGAKREPAVLGKGWKYEQVSVTPEESQFLQTQGYSEAQCARMFGPGFAEILGYDSGASMTYANLDSRLAHLLVLGMNKWLRRFERLLTSMLPNPQYARINRAAMLETTTIERYQAHALALQNQWKVVNEVRNDEEMEPVSWGDVPNAIVLTPKKPDSPPSEGGQ